MNTFIIDETNTLTLFEAVRAGLLTFLEAVEIEIAEFPRYEEEAQA